MSKNKKREENSMNQRKTKIMACMLVFVMMFTYFSIVKDVVAVSLEAQTTKTNNSNIEFDAYLMEDGTKTYAAIKNIGEENVLYAKVNVKEAGYLKDASILIENPNFKILDMTGVKEVSKVEGNRITLNQIKNGNVVEIAIPIQMQVKDLVNKAEFNKENKVSFTGTYVDGNGKEKKIEKDITVILAWTNEKKAELESSLTKFIPYSIAGQNGLMLQMKVQSYLKDNLLPVKQNKIEISIPTIENQKPTKVKVLANTTKATNGDDSGINFTEENYTYNEETGILTIQVQNNENEEGIISWSKQAQDEFIITAIYGVNEISQTKISYNAASELTLIEASETHARKTIEREEIITDPVGTLTEYDLQTSVDTIKKGQIYANYNAINKIETVYEELLTANVTLANIVDKIVLEQGQDSFINKESQKVSAGDNTYYKSITIGKVNFDKLFGEEGFIKVYSGTTLLATIDKNMQADEQQNLVVDLSQYNVSNIKIETSKPQTEGKVQIKLVKALKGEISYTLAQVNQFVGLELNATGKAINGETPFVEQNITKTINLEETTSQAEIQIDNTNLSTVVTNQNVKIIAVLKTDTLDCSLYSNPTLKITLPSYIENVNVKNVEALFETEGTKLEIANTNLITNTDGTKTLEISLSGTQTEYTLGAVSKGINIVVTTDLTVNKLTPNKEDKIVLNYTNGNDQKQVETKVNFVAPTGIVAISAISNYKENAETLTAISEEEKTATIDTLAGERVAKFEMNLINNYNNTIDNISILGRIPFKGNTWINTGVDLGSTMNMNLVSDLKVAGVDASKVSVYYSENGNATKDLNLASNGWTNSVQDLAKVKSYLIVLNDVVLNTGDGISFNYDALLPGNLQYNESAYQNYVAYFNNNLEAGTIQDKAISTKLGVTTGRGPIIEASLTSNKKETEEVQTGDIIKYTLTVKNTGTEPAQNVVATIKLPNCLTNIEFVNEKTQYYKENREEQLTYNIGILGVNEAKTIEFWVIADNLETQDICTNESHFYEHEGKKYHDDEKYVHSDDEYIAVTSVQADITINDMNNSVKTNEVKNTITKAYFDIQGYTSSDEVIGEGDALQYNYTVKLYDGGRQAENTILTMEIPNGLKYESARIRTYNIEEDKSEYITDGINYNERTKVLTINLGKTESGANGIIEINTIVEKLPDGVYEKEVKAIIKVRADGIEEEISKTIINNIAKDNIKISQTSTIANNETIKALEDYSYKYEVENNGGKLAENLNFVTKIPEQLQYISTELNVNGKISKYYNIEEDGTVKVNFSVEKGQIAKITVNVVAKSIGEDAKVLSVATISSETIEKQTSNTITHTIQKINYDEIDDPENTGNTDNVMKRIIGQVWKDENNDGIKDQEETKISNVEVMLFNNNTAKFVTDAGGNTLKVKTDKDGIYTFTNIAKGNYTVIFMYDTANYSSTTYRKENVDETKNSDAVDSKITIDGVTKVAAITEVISITNSNIYNIDLGLIKNAKFDLSLNKTVSKITVQDSDGTNVYEYKDSKLAKKELVGKKVNDTTIVVEYKITVTNEGAIPGYVKKIVDYMPSEMKFSSELNRDWYTSGSGAIFNSSLSNTIINPGETKEVKLILTKKMTEDTLGLINNTAEIYESYNDLGLEDVDSKIANKISGEDDMSGADILITVKTGEAVLFIGLTITIITVIGTTAYFIKKKVLR